MTDQRTRSEEAKDRAEEARKRRSEMRDTFGRDLPPLPGKPLS